MNVDLSFIVGTYEELVLSYDLSWENGEGKFTTSFTDHSHTASVRTVAVNASGIAASGSADETIKLFDTNKRVEIGSLLQHQGAVTSLQFFGKTHLFSCSEDGTIAIFQAGTWECLRTLRGHKGAVYSVCLHPSGKLALSCGKDKTLRTWNLITGRCAFVTNLKQVADSVLWSPNGERYVVITGSIVDVYSSETATVSCTLSVSHKISSAVFLNDTLLAVGCEKGFVYIYDVVSGKNVCEIDSKTNRVKSLAALNIDTISSPCIALATSDGFIKVYQINTQKDDDIIATKLAEHNTGFRLLSVAIFRRRNITDVTEIPTSVKDTQVERKRSPKVKKVKKSEKPNGENKKQTVKRQRSSGAEISSGKRLKRRKTE